VVAAGLAAFAIGTETWGSIICPSGFTGTTGLRPTLGRVSRYGAMALAYSMDKIGPMCRLADDCDLVLKTIAGHDPQDGYSLPDPQAKYLGAEQLKAPLRIGWLLNQWKEVSAEVDKPAAVAREVLEKNQSVVMSTITLPEGPWETAAGVIVSAEGAAAFHQLIESGRVTELSDPLGKIGGYMNEEISASDLLLAERIRTVLQKKMDELFRHVDVLATPSLPVTASRIDANLDVALTFADPLGGIGNMCGLPAISVPCGFGQNNLPVGIQFVGRELDDAKVVQAARLFQNQTDWHKRHPKLA
jgi:aspartyl-tRNA(Asn)/glutamyl-tRNA(Gln) amidotransferase subunit A